jgi:hypothetical protein
MRAQIHKESFSARDLPPGGLRSTRNRSLQGISRTRPAARPARSGTPQTGAQIQNCRLTRLQSIARGWGGLVRLEEMDRNVTLVDQLSGGNRTGHPRQRVQSGSGGSRRAARSMGGRCRVSQAEAGFHLHATSSRRKRKLCLSELCRLGVGGAFRNAFRDPDFQATFARYPSSTVASPHLFQKVAVPGICVDR